MNEYVKKANLLAAAVEVEYLGRPRMMVSAAKIEKIPGIDIVRCKECKYWLSDKPIKNKWFQNGEIDQCKWRTDESPNADDFCSYGERAEQTEPKTDCSWR